MPGAGVEPARLTAIDLKSIVATNYTTRAKKVPVGIEPTYRSFADSCLDHLATAPLNTSFNPFFLVNFQQIAFFDFRWPLKTNSAFKSLFNFLGVSFVMLQLR